MSEKRELLKQQYGQLYDEIFSILFRHDMAMADEIWNVWSLK
jgi:hypothetical protein